MTLLQPLDLTPQSLPDIKPRTPVTSLDRDRRVTDYTFPIELVAPVVGFAPSFIRRALGHAGPLTADDIVALLDLDAFEETFVRRSQVLEFLTAEQSRVGETAQHLTDPETYALYHGEVLETLRRVRVRSIQCVVTSTPYWGMRIYEEPRFVRWADGEVCPLGHEQTPEGFLRHSTEVLYRLLPVLTEDASVWWNVMDSFNTRTQIRGNAAEALRAMQGHDSRAWGDHECRRYSAGHAFLKDGEQCLIPSRIAHRAARLGYYVKSVITWSKGHTLPEPQNSRVSRNLEYILHLSKVRTPRFEKSVYRDLPPAIGGRNPDFENDKLSDVWTMSTSNGGNGHGAQFPVALPGRCIALTTAPGDLVLDPFVGSGNTGLAARELGRRFVGIDVSETYLKGAEVRLAEARDRLFSAVP